MGQSLSKLYVHLIFSTKGRKPYITAEVRPKLISSIIGILKEQSCPSIQTNAVADHVHILFSISKNVALSKVVEQVKKRTSKWMKRVEGGNPKFSWQIGYAAFSVSSSVLKTVARYVENQEAHHRKQSLKKEVEEFVDAYEAIEYDAAYFWD